MIWHSELETRTRLVAFFYSQGRITKEDYERYILSNNHKEKLPKLIN